MGHLSKVVDNYDICNRICCWIYGRHIQKSIPMASNKPRQKLLVAAIDFGTTFSGWAYLFGHQYESNPTKVYDKNWNNGRNISMKTPTTVLIKPDGQTLEAFGYKAEDRYAELAAENEHHSYFYFQHFKMKLHTSEKLKRNLLLEDEMGWQLPAITVFSLAIAYLKDDLLQECQKQITDGCLLEGDIDWVLTVPSIWSPAAKQFMREAALEAGIKTDKLIIALEPEVASIYCQRMSVCMKDSAGEGLTLDTFPPGTEYIVLDAGGGTVDIAVHRVLEDGRVKELHRSTGGAWGGSNVNTRFREFLNKIFSKPVMEKFCKENMDDYLDLIRTFEVKKRSVSCTNDTTYYLQLPTTLVECYKDTYNEDFSKICNEIFEQMSFRRSLSLVRGNKLKFDSDVMRHFFNEEVVNVSDHLASVLQDLDTVIPEFILMVGGFSESPVLQQKISEQFRNLRILVPPEPSLVVLKGAAIFGHETNVIAGRVLQFTYGLICDMEFEEGFHPEQLAFIKNGKKVCRDGFLKIAEIGETVKVNERREFPDSFFPQGKNCMLCRIYASIKKEPRTVHDPGNFCLGCIRINLQHKNDSKHLQYKICGIFGQTEFKIEVREVHNNSKLTSVFDSLE